MGKCWTQFWATLTNVLRVLHSPLHTAVLQQGWRTVEASYENSSARGTWMLGEC
jgi:hypothetical protein